MRMVTYSDLCNFAIVLVSVITLVIVIIDRNK